MSLTKGQLMTQHQKTRKELGTVTYSRLVKPNILDDYTLYLKDLTEMEELDKTKENLVVDKQSKNIDLTKKNSIFDLLENKSQKKEKEDKQEQEDKQDKEEHEDKQEQEEDKDKEDKGDKEDKEDKGDNDKTSGKKLLKITVSTNPDGKSNKLML